MIPNTPEVMNCIWLASKSMMSTNHMAMIKPTVPKTLIGGKSFTMSIPAFCNALKATELDNANVGI